MVFILSSRLCGCADGTSDTFKTVLYATGRTRAPALQWPIHHHPDTLLFKVGDSPGGGGVPAGSPASGESPL